MLINDENYLQVIYDTSMKEISKSFEKEAIFILLGKKGEVLIAGLLPFSIQNNGITANKSFTICDSGYAKKAFIISNDNKIIIELKVISNYRGNFILNITQKELIKEELINISFTLKID